MIPLFTTDLSIKMFIRARFKIALITFALGIEVYSDARLQAIQLTIFIELLATVVRSRSDCGWLHDYAPYYDRATPRLYFIGVNAFTIHLYALAYTNHHLEYIIIAAKSFSSKKAHPEFRSRIPEFRVLQQAFRQQGNSFRIWKVLSNVLEL